MGTGRDYCLARRARLGLRPCLDLEAASAQVHRQVTNPIVASAKRSGLALLDQEHAPGSEGMFEPFDPGHAPFKHDRQTSRPVFVCSISSWPEGQTKNVALRSLLAIPHTGPVPFSRRRSTTTSPLRSAVIARRHYPGHGCSLRDERRPSHSRQSRSDALTQRHLHAAHLPRAVWSSAA